MENCDNLELGKFIGLPQLDIFANKLKDQANKVKSTGLLTNAIAKMAQGKKELITSEELDQLIKAERSPKEYIDVPIFIERYNKDPDFRNFMLPILQKAGINLANTRIEDTLTTSTNLKKYIPYIIMVLVIGFLVFYIVKRK
jgi:DNA-binding Xre family transcriptional regulator